MEYRRGRMKAYLNYAYTDSRYVREGRVPEIAPHGANAGIQYAFTRSFRAGLRGQYLGERKNSKLIPSTGNDRIDDAVVLHANVSLDLPLGFDCRLIANNLLDAVYYHPSNLPPSRYRQPRRYIRLAVGYAF